MVRAGELEQVRAEVVVVTQREAQAELGGAEHVDKGQTRVKSRGVPVGDRPGEARYIARA